MAGREVRMVRGGAVAWAAAAMVIVAQPPSAAADTAADYEKLVKEKTAAYVAVKYVLKVEGAFDDSADEAETTGIMIDAKGLVLCGNAALGGGSFGRYGGSRPTEIKVLVGKDTEGLPATLLARDSELGLAWIQVKKPPGEDFAFIDFAKAATPKLGQRLLGLRRMGKYFDRAVVVSEGRVAGQTKKPRELLVPSEGLQAGWGLPVFAEDGLVVGVFVMQMPDDADQSGDFFSFMGGAQDMFGGLILPAAEVVKATKQARETKGQGGPLVAQPPSAVGVAQPPSAVDVAQPPSAVGVAQPPPAVSVTQPPPAVSVAQPPPAVDVAQPPSAVDVAQPPPAVSVAQPPPAVSVTQPPSAVDVTQPPSAVDVAQPPPAVSVTQPPPAVSVAQPPSAVNVAQPPPAVDVAQPPPTVNVAQPPSAVSVAQPPSAVNVAQPPPAVDVAQPPPAVDVAQPPPAVERVVLAHGGGGRQGDQPAGRAARLTADAASDQSRDRERAVFLTAALREKSAEGNP